MRWKHWDLLALCAGVTPLFMALTADLLGLHYGGSLIGVGSLG